MLPWVPNLIAAVSGVAIGLIMVLAAFPSTPVVILRAGSTEAVPGFLNSSSTSYPTGFCSLHPCGTAGVVQSSFSVSFSARLTGTLNGTGPFSLDIANYLGQVSVACTLQRPPHPCPNPVGTVYTFFLQRAHTSVNLASLQLNFNGANNDLPPGDWTIYLVNWNSGPIEVTAETPLVASPT